MTLDLRHLEDDVDALHRVEAERLGFGRDTAPRPPRIYKPHADMAVKRVALIGLGVTAGDYLTLSYSKATSPGAPGSTSYWDEVWTINRGLRCWHHDLVFVLDDLRNEALGDPDYGARLRDHDRPIITSTPYPEFPMALEYPILEVLEHVGAENFYFHNSVPLILAYAHLIGVQEMTLFGCDYHHPMSSVIEEERANAEYWVGWCRAKGMRIGVPPNTTLLNTNQAPRLYGWLGHVPLHVQTKVRELNAQQRGARDG